MDWPITFRDVLEARRRIRPFVSPTPFRTYKPLDEVVGEGIRIFVKHESDQCVQS